MLNLELIDIATRHQVYLERLKAGELKKTDVLFQRLNENLLRVLGRLNGRELSVLSLIERAALLEDLRAGNQEAYTVHLKALIAMLAELSTFSREFELESINEVLVDEVEADDDGGAGLWAKVQERPLSATGALLAAWLGGWVAHEVTRSTDLFRRGIAEGWTLSTIQQAYRGTADNNYSDGLYASAKRNTATVINTAVQHVSSTSRAETMATTTIRPKGDGIKVNKEGRVSSISRRAAAAAKRAGIKVGDKVSLMGYRWISILDSKTSQICRSLDQRVFQFGKGPLPPAHPNCRSSIVAEIAGRWTKRDPLGRFSAREPRPSTGAAGPAPVPGGTSYYEWLKTQPEAFQDDALGVTRATLFRKGGMSADTFAKLNLGRNFRPLTLDEMRRLKPNAFRRAGI